MEGAMTPRPEWAAKAVIIMVIASTLFRCVSAARNHSVGGPSGWDLASNVQAWSATSTFHVGDSLVFAYTPAHDVLEVNELEFATCHTTNPISVHNDGETVVRLTQTGPRFFICGRHGHCTMGLKFRVDVLPQVESNANETSGLPRRPPRGAPRRPPPPPRDIQLPPPFPDTTPGPSANSGEGGMITDEWLDWWAHVTNMLLLTVALFLLGIE